MIGLTLVGVSSWYGASDVLREVSLEVPAGGIVGLLGPNGAGKTTLARTVSGLLPARSGTITLGGRPIRGRKAHEIAALGLMHVPQGRLLFPEFTVLENLEMGAYLRRDRAGVREARERVQELFPVLRARRSQLAGTLSGGEQQMLAIARALMNNPRLLILDEPSVGLAPRAIAEIFRVIEEVNARGVTVLLAEQNARLALDVARFCYVLQNGRIAVEGPSRELLADERVRRSYLGIR